MLTLPCSLPITVAIQGSAARGDLDILRLFLNHGADPTLIDGRGWDAATWILDIGRPVYGHGSSGKCQSQRQRESTNLWLTRDAVDMLRLLAHDDPSFDIHRRDEDGRTLLMLAEGQPLPVYQYLLNSGVDATALDNEGNNVLHCYFVHFYYQKEHLSRAPDTLRLLIQAGADPHHRNDFGQLPYEMCDANKWEKTHPLSFVRFQMQSVIWEETLRRCGIKTTRTPTRRLSVWDAESSSQRSFLHDQSESFPFKLAPSSDGHLSYEAMMIAILQKWDPIVARSRGRNSKWWTQRVVDGIHENVETLLRELTHMALEQNTVLENSIDIKQEEQSEASTECEEET